MWVSGQYILKYFYMHFLTNVTFLDSVIIVLTNVIFLHPVTIVLTALFYFFNLLHY